MTSPEIKTTENASQVSFKKMGGEIVTRKASFKCPVPNKTASQRITRKVMVPMSTVQALAFKFNELSQINEDQKHKISQTAVKNMMVKNGKSSTIKVVVCRKPSTSKYKRSEDGILRRKINVRRYQSNNHEFFDESNRVQKYVHQRINAFEEKKKVEAKQKPLTATNKNRTEKMQVPKILVDIDLNTENCLEHEDISVGEKLKLFVNQENSLSVKTAISLFEKNSKRNISEKQSNSAINKLANINKRDKEFIDNNLFKPTGSEKENFKEAKTKPIAAIKPILKKPEGKIARPIKLSPKDSLNRKKYFAMKKETKNCLEENDLKKKDLKNSDLNTLNVNNNNNNNIEKHQIIQINKENEKRLKNNSSLHKKPANFTVITNEIFLNGENIEDQKLDSEVMQLNIYLKPNTSFLWSKKEEQTIEKKSLSKIDIPLPVPPEKFVTDVEDTIYDDVQPACEETESEELEKVSDLNEDDYDDIKPYCKNKSINDKMLQCIKNENFCENVLEKNILNNQMNAQNSENLYSSGKSSYLYDDGEGERYHYISDVNENLNAKSVKNDFEVYQYIQNVKENNNIYEDIQSIRCQLNTKDKTKDIYEDINCMMDSTTDNASITNCYETVYNGIYSNNNGNESYLKSDVSEVSNHSGRSTYEKNNSLYGMSAKNVVGSNHCLNLGENNSSTEYLGYQVSNFGCACPNSETSQSNSDEWVEVTESDSEGTVYLVQERPKKTKTIGSTWSQKERRRWKRLQKKYNFEPGMKLGKPNANFLQEEILDTSTWSGSSNDSGVKKRPLVGDIIFISSHSFIYLGDFENKIINLHAYDFDNDVDNLKILFTIPRPALRKKFKPSPTIRALLYKTDQRECQEITLFLEDEIQLNGSEDHFYESVGHYENAEIFSEKSTTLQNEQTNYSNPNNFCNEEQFIDDFDSQSSQDEVFVDAKLPDIPNHSYNITKSLKAAGKKLKKNFSLRKSDLSKSLKRFKKSSRPKINEIRFSDTNVEVESLQKQENPSTPTNQNNSIYSNNSDSSGSSLTIVKNSNIDKKNQRQGKSWTFRKKSKTKSLEIPENTTSIDTNRNSTFYLSLNEIQPEEKKDELLTEIQTVLSKRSSNSVENMFEKGDKDVAHRFNDFWTTAGKLRPSVPPPPPPPPPATSKVDTPAEKTKYSDILWGEKATNKSLYVESGLFDKQKKHLRCSETDGSLYAEIGLYATNEESITTKKTQMFVDEPLYQFYTECVNQRARDDILNNYDSEGYEEINDFYSVINEKRRTIDIKNVRPNFEDFNEDVRPKISSIRSISDRRTLWCQIPVVVNSCILQTLTEQARKLQEAKFEILTSEGSYMNSLNVLENHFMKKVSDSNIIAKRDFRILFSNIVSVKKCSENFLEDLENCWQNNIMLNGICDIVYKHSTNSFKVYTKYCKNQVCIYRTLRELIDKNSSFEMALKEMESDPICQNLNIHSFLMLPMQRITRLPLLMGAVLARMDKTDDEYESCKASFDVLNKIVQDCDDEARRMEKCEEILILSQHIEFPKDIRRIPIITGSRFLVKSGQVTQLVNRDENKLTFGKKFSKINLTLFLFTDLLILAKKKNPRNYVVVDHCPRNLVQMQTTDGLTQLPLKLNINTDTGGKMLMLLTMLENHEKKTVEMILSFEMESDRQRWLEAVTPKLSENPDECIYEEWDCPQVIALYEFTPTQPDELNLCIGDVVNVLKKMNDGWYQGERLRDGARGWFPQNHTQEISSSHVRAKNKKLRYKLLALSGNLIDSQKLNGK